MAILMNRYTMYWDKTNGTILYDFRNGLKGYEVAFGYGTKVYMSDNLDDCYKVFEQEKLNDDLSLMIEDEKIHPKPI